MSVPLRNDEPNLSRRDQMTVSTAAMSEVPWGASVAAGAVVTGADLLLHLTTLHLGLGGVGSSLAAGTVAMFSVAGGGVLLRGRASRAIRWARRNPWQFAVLPGVATAVVVFVLSVIFGSGGVLGDTFTALWHGAITYGLTGAAGIFTGRREKSR